MTDIHTSVIWDADEDSIILGTPLLCEDHDGDESMSEDGNSHNKKWMIKVHFSVHPCLSCIMISRLSWL